MWKEPVMSAKQKTSPVTWLVAVAVLGAIGIVATVRIGNIRADGREMNAFMEDAEHRDMHFRNLPHTHKVKEFD